MKNKLLILAMGLALISQTLFAQVPSYIPTNGLVGYWPFNGNANDVSGNGNNGTNSGAFSTTDRFGNENSAFRFDGTNRYITLPPSANLQTSSSFTVSVWFYSLTNELVYDGYEIIGDRDATSYDFRYRIIYGLSNLNTNNTSPNLLQSCTSNSCSQISIPFPSLNVWDNYVISFDGTNNTLKGYKNGILLGEQSNVVFNSGVNRQINLGRVVAPNYPNGFSFVNGKIDDIGIWNRSLSQSEITAVYNGVTYSETCNNVSGSLTQGLVGYWPFCGNANDDSGNGNNGTINGATLTNDRFGNANSAYRFNGTTNYISIPSNSFPTEQRTISAWIKCNGVLNGGTSPYDYQTLIDYGTAGGIMLKMTDFKWLYNYGPNNQPTTNSSINQNTWYNLVFTLDSNANCKFFINGNLVGSGNISNFTPVDLSNPTTASIGRSSNNAWYWNGTIDDVGIWNRVLTQEEVTQLFNQNQCLSNITVTDTLVINVGQLSFNDPVTWANNITIAPNPASTEININFNNITDLNGGTIKIINSLGQQVATTPITVSGTNTSMQLATWGGAGMYFVQIINPQGQIVDIKKIILQ